MTRWPEHLSAAAVALAREGIGPARSAQVLNARFGCEHTSDSVAGHLKRIARRPSDEEQIARALASVGHEMPPVQETRAVAAPPQQAAPTVTVQRPLPAPGAASIVSGLPRRGTIGVIADGHADEENRDTWRIALDAIRGVDIVVILGDLLSLPGLSKHPRHKPTVDRYLHSTSAGNRALDNIRAAAPNATIFWTEGNHEHWIEQYVADHPEMEGTLSIEAQLHLKARGIVWIPEDRPLILPWGLYHHGHAAASSLTACRYYADKYAPRFVWRKPAFFGHWHTLETFDSQTGCYAQCCGYLGSEHPTYLRANQPGWASGLRFQEFDGEDVNSMEVRIRNGRAVWGERQRAA